MRLDLLFIEDVCHLDAARFQIIRNESAMTTPPDCFRAHDRSRPNLVRKIDKSLDAPEKFIRFHVIGVSAERGVAPGGVF